MILSDKTLLKMIEAKSLIIEPLEKKQVQPASVDIRLGNTFSIVEDSSTGIINLENEIKYKTITRDTYILLPNQFVRVLSFAQTFIRRYKAFFIYQINKK